MDEGLAEKVLDGRPLGDLDEGEKMRWLELRKTELLTTEERQGVGGKMASLQAMASELSPVAREYGTKRTTKKSPSHLSDSWLAIKQFLVHDD